MAEIVLDASAVIARLKSERGAGQVADVLEASVLSSVNLAEIVGKLVDFALADEVIAEFVRSLPCRIEPFDAALAVQSGLLRGPTREAGLSLGDRACLALAQRLGSPAMTADRAWAGLDLGVEVVLIR